MGKSNGNPERNWGRPSWPVGPGNGTNKKTVRDSQDGKGCFGAALLILSAPLALGGALYELIF